MRILVLSDLHLEHQPNWSLDAVVPHDFDVAVFAGDTSSPPSRSVEIAHAFGQRHAVPVVMVAGNHEFYGHDLVAAELAGLERAAQLGVHYLTPTDDRGVVVIDDTRFVGATLWTDYALWSTGPDDREDQQAFAMRTARQNLNDHRAIHMMVAGVGRKIWSPVDALRVHERDRAHIDAALAVEHDGPTVVVTHHAPHYDSITDRRRRPGTVAISPAYASDLSALIEARQPELWVHGHTHDSVDYQVASTRSTRVMSNPKGYGPHVGVWSSVDGGPENAEFNPNMVVEVLRRDHDQRWSL